MQAPTPAPAAPQPGVTVIQVPPPGAPTAPGEFRFTLPRTRREVDAIRNQREELSNQLISARERRTQLAKQYEEASGANRAGLESQLRVLDDRIVQLEKDIAETGRLLTSPQAGTIGVPPPLPDRPFRPNGGQITGISIVFTLFVLAPMAVAAARLMWRRATRPTLPPGWSDASMRFERLEQAVDAIAIEIERVSEGQRFITRIMTDRGAGAQAAPAESTPALNGQGQPLPALGAGSPDQILAQQKNEQEAVRVRRT